MATILMGMLLAELCGEDQPSGLAAWTSWRARWITQALGLKRERMPDHQTDRRLRAEGIGEAEFERPVPDDCARCGESGDQVVAAMAGKVLRGTLAGDRGEEPGRRIVFLPGEGVTLAQVAIPSKHNEISAAPRLPGCINVRHKVVNGDALHTLRPLCPRRLRRSAG